MIISYVSNLIYFGYFGYFEYAGVLSNPEYWHLLIFPALDLDFAVDDADYADFDYVAVVVICLNIHYCYTQHHN